MNTMEDLREELVELMRKNIHGREIDYFTKKRPAIPHMLGITPIGEEHKAANEKGTILDADHEFWESWHDEHVTGWIAEDKVKTAINSLIEDDTITWTYKNGDPDSDIIYVEVEDITADTNAICRECGDRVEARTEYQPNGNNYRERIIIDCDCGFTGVYASTMMRL